MAPEQVDPCWGVVSARTDVWGLGGVLLFLLTGQTPHGGRDVAEVLAQVVSGSPVNLPEAAASSLPRPIVDVIRRCLAKPPEERFASALELAESLAAAIAST